jgi:peptidoglycan/xylan/chitin deacetylase (PgdA/CDA1 family)
MNLNSRARLKGLLGDILWHFPSRQISRLLVGRDRGLVLMFHYVGSPILLGVSEDLFLSKQEFINTLDFVTEHLCPLDPLDFLDGLSAGNLPSGATLLTFDDGTKDNVTVVLPELLKRNLKACFFVCPGFIESRGSIPSLELMTILSTAAPKEYQVDFGKVIPDSEAKQVSIDLSNTVLVQRAYQLLWSFLFRCSSRRQPLFLRHLRESLNVSQESSYLYPVATWEELTALKDAGMLIGNHTMFHSTVTADGADQFASDVARAFAILEARYPVHQRLFCYPYGRKVDVTEATTKALKLQNVKYAFVTQGGLARPNALDAWNLHREQASYSIAALKLTPLLAMFR